MYDCISLIQGSDMIEVVFGDYIVRNSDILLTQFEGDFFNVTEFNKDKTYIMIAEEVGLTKERLTLLKDVAKTNIRIIAQDRSLVKNMRSSKNFKITYEREFVDVNPFDITKSILTVKDRDYIYNFLKTNKVSLYMPVKCLTSNYSDLCEVNKQIVKFLDLNLWRVEPDILYSIIAYRMKVEPYFRFVKWNFPKKKDNNE